MQRYFSKESESILNGAHGEKVDFGQTKPRADHYMPMMANPMEGERVMRARGGSVKRRADGGSLVMDEPETKMKRGGSMKKCHGGSMKK